MLLPVSRRLDFSEIPLVDIGPLMSGVDDGAAIAALGAACTGVGFVYVSNHGVTTQLVHDVVAQAARFFARPMDEKRAITVDQRMRGYLPLNYESLAGQPGGGVSSQEGFFIGYERALDAENLLDGPNVWPASAPGLASVMNAYFAALEPLCDVLLRGFASALGLERDAFVPLFTTPQSLLKVNHYPPQVGTASEDRAGVVGHCDSGGFTILWQDDNGGLEVQTKSGDWVGAPPVPETFVINIGNVMQMWSDGRFSSTPHRVVNRSGVDRYSVPLFVNPAFDVPIAPRVEGTVAAGPRFADYQRDVWRKIFPVAGIPA